MPRLNTLISFFTFWFLAFSPLRGSVSTIDLGLVKLILPQSSYSDFLIVAILDGVFGLIFILLYYHFAKGFIFNSLGIILSICFSTLFFYFLMVSFVPPPRTLINPDRTVRLDMLFLHYLSCVLGALLVILIQYLKVKRLRSKTI